MSSLDGDQLRRLRHDLRSPLVVINGFAQLLAGERPITEDERRDYAARIQRAAEELETMLEHRLGAET